MLDWIITKVSDRELTLLTNEYGALQFIERLLTNSPLNDYLQIEHNKVIESKITFDRVLTYELLEKYIHKYLNIYKDLEYNLTLNMEDVK